MERYAWKAILKDGKFEEYDLSDEDVMYLRNILLHEFNVAEPYEGEINTDEIDNLSTSRLF